MLKFFDEEGQLFQRGSNQAPVSVLQVMRGQDFSNKFMQERA